MVQRISPVEFDRLVQRCVDRIPRRFARELKNVVFLVEADPPAPGLLGLYQGVPLTLRQGGNGFLPPDRITIYQHPHEALARSGEELERIVDATVWHEVGHFFGLNEEQVRRAEVRRARAAERLARDRRKGL